MKELILNQEINDLNKSELKKLAEKLSSDLDTEDIVVLSRFKVLVDELFSRIQGKVREDMQISNSQSLKIGNIEVQRRNGSDILDYDQDLKYANLKAELAERKKRLDLAHKRWHQYHEDFPDPETGEIVPVVKVKGARKDSIIIKL